MKNIRRFINNLLISEIESLEVLSLSELKSQKRKFTLFKWLNRILSLTFAAMTSYMVVYHFTLSQFILGFGISMINALIAGYWLLLEYAAEREIEILSPDIK